LDIVLSGDKLANHQNFRNKLLGIEPEAIGGEMEGQASTQQLIAQSRLDPGQGYL